MTEGLLRKLEDFRLLPIFVIVSMAIGIAIASTGTLVAIRSVQLTPSFVFFGMEYPRFLLSMFTEIGLFTAFIGVENALANAV